MTVPYRHRIKKTGRWDSCPEKGNHDCLIEVKVTAIKQLNFRYFEYRMLNVVDCIAFKPFSQSHFSWKMFKSWKKVSRRVKWNRYKQIFLRFVLYFVWGRIRVRKIRAMRKCSPSLYFKSSKKGFTSQLLFDFLVC